MKKRSRKNCLHLACRHHIHELIVEKVFDSTVPEISSGPNIKLFQRFADSWEGIKKDDYESLEDDKITLDEKQKVEQCIKEQLNEHQPRDDCRELLQLSLIFIGGEVPKHLSKIRAPGAFHKARWMAKLIYCLKIFLFRKQFKLRAKELSGLQAFNIFVVKVYIRHWFLCQVAVYAPLNDLTLLKTLIKYGASAPTTSLERAISSSTLRSFSRHLWYLCEKLVGLAFFDDRVSVNEKKAMVKALSHHALNEGPRRKINEVMIPDLQLSHLITEKTRSFFEHLRVDPKFLQIPPENWSGDQSYQEGLKVAQGLKVVHDSAERGVALIQQFNNTRTIHEDQQQYMLQVVERHRQRFPGNVKKSNL